MPKRPATYDDLEAVPEHLVAEIIDGALLTHHHGVPRSASARTGLSYALRSFQFSLPQRGSWRILHLPELWLGGHVMVPDFCGWQIARLSVLPDTRISIVPNWICEIMSDETVCRDRGAKRDLYAALGVKHLWLIDPKDQTLETFALIDGEWVSNGDWNSADEVRAPPFDAISFSLAALWPLDPPLGFNEDSTPYYAGDR